MSWAACDPLRKNAMPLVKARQPTLLASAVIPCAANRFASRGLLRYAQIIR